MKSTFKKVYDKALRAAKPAVPKRQYIVVIYDRSGSSSDGVPMNTKMEAIFAAKDFWAELSGAADPVVVWSYLNDPKTDEIFDEKIVWTPVKIPTHIKKLQEGYLIDRRAEYKRVASTNLHPKFLAYFSNP
jgi:hypothetical protein